MRSFDAGGPCEDHLYIPEKSWVGLGKYVNIQPLCDPHTKTSYLELQDLVGLKWLATNLIVETNSYILYHLCMVYLPTFTIQNQPYIGNHTTLGSYEIWENGSQKFHPSKTGEISLNTGEIWSCVGKFQDHRDDTSVASATSSLWTKICVPKAHTFAAEITFCQNSRYYRGILTTITKMCVSGNLG